ncbi:serine/threonine protein phosphatase [Verrucomicrobiaceae bacterium 5K15]|uniref:Serine/threonine protein phosphatase n=1 Tax=Oceaniferula flava TaxID=2800421 RepID=A0AAE2V9N1_9BACT|nr:metallophosphoesterase family protein [Oceaniferula flavus]MBK1855418.1 serine/threonine protein phosphatase [Oceaniferula flavus]MBM1136724.1 serine/threonine protein phosphatase [Oceaniferula flavus]
MRTLAIGDIHGCIAPLKQLWEVIDPQPEDRIIFMGDYVDRGPDSKGVIDFLIELQQQDFNITLLSGNHEEKFALSRIDKTDLAHWLEAWGGVETLESYGPGGMDDVPASHWEFVRTLKPYVETDSHIFVHANLEADVPLSEQLPFTMIHKKFGTPKPHMSGKVMICGHTAQKNHVPLNLGHAVCIDTDPGRGGWLTCLEVETSHYWQVNAEGEVREAELGEPESI